MNILIVDDEIANAPNRYTQLLTDHVVRICRSEAEFILKKDMSQWNLVLVDTEFPQINGGPRMVIGYRIANEAAEMFPNAKVIMISGDARLTLPTANSNPKVYGTNTHRTPAHVANIVATVAGDGPVELVQGGEDNRIKLSRAIHAMGSRFAALRLDVHRLNSCSVEFVQKVNEVADASFGCNGYLSMKQRDEGEYENPIQFISRLQIAEKIVDYNLIALRSALDATVEKSKDITDEEKAHAFLESLTCVLVIIDSADAQFRNAREQLQ